MCANHQNGTGRGQPADHCHLHTTYEESSAKGGARRLRPRLLHGLLEDPDRRLQFCEMMREQISNEPDHLDKIIWSDEAPFKLSGHLNRHNCVHWADETPHLIITSQLNQPDVTVHCPTKVL